MKRIFTKYLWIIIFFITLIFSSPIKTNAINVENDSYNRNESNYNDYDYIIEGYNIDINVNENNTLDITETIMTHFNIPKHGIFREIPLKNEIVRLDGTKSTNYTQVTDLYVNEQYTTSKENSNLKVKIGSSNNTLIGNKVYVIKYKYNLGKDPIKNYDELYFNIIGNEWDTIIENVTFNITMPKEFDSSKLGFSSGFKGFVDNSKVNYFVNENKISGNYNDILNIGEGITVRLELPEGYFVNASLKVNKKLYFLYLIPILFLLVAIYLWYKFGRDEKEITSLEFYPPNGLNSLDVALIFKGKAESKDVTSLLVFLANKGYIEIKNNNIDVDSINLDEEAKEKALKKITDLEMKIAKETEVNPNSQKIKYYENMLDIYKNIDTPIDYNQYGLKSSIKRQKKENKFIIKKLKDYDGNDINEQWFMEGLFEFGRVEVTDDMLYNRFHVTTYNILDNVNSKSNINKIFERSSLNKKIIIILMILISFCLISIPPVITYNEIELLLMVIPFTSFGFTVMFLGIFKKGNIFEKIFSILIGLVIAFVPNVIYWPPAILQNNLFLIGYIIDVICIGGMFLCYKYLPKRTKYGREMLGKIKGFKNFLEIAEKEKLEALVLENPNYFYEILPFTYVLNISSKWIKKFEAINMQAPSWYDNFSSFDISNFSSFMDSTMDSAHSVMTSSPSSSSDSSGGGSSGGGSGGGGGGSW